MDISSIAGRMSGDMLNNSIQISLMKKSMELQETMTNQLLEGFSQVSAKSMELSVNPGLGANFDMRI